MTTSAANWKVALLARIAAFAKAGAPFGFTKLRIEAIRFEAVALIRDLSSGPHRRHLPSPSGKQTNASGLPNRAVCGAWRHRVHLV